MSTVSSGAGAESQTILVVGGGIAGVTAALEAAEAGQEVILVERDASLGGRVTRLNRYFPKLCHPACGLEINYQRLRRNPRHPRDHHVRGRRRFRALAAPTGRRSRRRPRYVNERCTACGDCAKAAEADGRIIRSITPWTRSRAPTCRTNMAFPMRYVIAPEAIAARRRREAQGGVQLWGSGSGRPRRNVRPSRSAPSSGPRDGSPTIAANLESYSYSRSPDIDHQCRDGAFGRPRRPDARQDPASLGRRRRRSWLSSSAPAPATSTICLIARGSVASAR